MSEAATQKPKTLQEFFSDECKWRKYSYFEDNCFLDCVINGSTPKCACIHGALFYVYGNISDKRYKIAEQLNSITYQRFGVGLTAYNDLPTTTFSDIRKLIKEANV